MHSKIPVVSGNCISRIRVWDSNGESYDTKFVTFNKNRINGTVRDTPVPKFAKILYPLPEVFRIKNGVILLKTQVAGIRFYDEFPIDRDNPKKTYDEVMDYFHNVFFYATLGKEYVPRPTVVKFREYIGVSFITRKSYDIKNIMRTNGNHLYGVEGDPYLVALQAIDEFLKSNPETVQDALQFNCKVRPLDYDVAEKISKHFPYKKMDKVSAKVGACQLSSVELEELLEIYNGTC